MSARQHANPTNLEMRNMRNCLTRAGYRQESFKGMTTKPEYRAVAAKAMFGATGMKRHAMWCSIDSFDRHLGKVPRHR